jgi:hypothetical protein
MKRAPAACKKGGPTARPGPWPADYSGTGRRAGDRDLPGFRSQEPPTRRKSRRDGFKDQAASDSADFVAQAGTSFTDISNGFVKTVPLTVLSNGGHGFGEGIGETRFWPDANRPAPSFIAENSPGTEFPATQVMRFNFFFTADAFPGKVFRSVGPAAMRSTNVLSFPPPSGTVYTLVAPVDLEDVAHPGSSPPAGRKATVPRSPRPCRPKG